MLQCRPGAQHIIIGCEIFGWLCELPILFDLGHANRQDSDNASDDVVLQRKHVRQRLLKACRKKHPSLPCVDELRDDRHAVAGLADAAFD